MLNDSKTDNIMLSINTTGCFNKMYPILVLRFERPRALMSLHITSYEFERLLVTFYTLLYDFGFLEAELQHVFELLYFSCSENMCLYRPLK